MTSENAYPILSQLFGGYLHQDWDLDYPDVGAAVADFAADLSPDERAGVTGELMSFRRSGQGEAALEAAMRRLGLAYVYRRDFPTAEGWLTYIEDVVRSTDAAQS